MRGVWRILAAAAAALLLAGSERTGRAFSGLDWSECEQSNDPSLSIRSCTHVISGHTASRGELASAYEHRGAAHAARREHSQALSDFTDAIHLTPRQGRLYVRRGEIYGGKGDSEQALADFNEALRIDPHDVRALLNRGQAWERRGDKEKAKADYHAALEAPAGKLSEKKASDVRERLAALAKPAAAAPAPVPVQPPAASSAPPPELARMPNECPKRVEDLESQFNDFLGWVDHINLDEYTLLRTSASDPCKIDRSRLQTMQSRIQQQSGALTSARVEFYQTCTSKEMTKIIDEIRKREPVIDKQTQTVTLYRTSILHSRLEKLSNMQVLAGKKSESIAKLSSRMKNLSEWAKDVVRDCSL
jgi:tetratricopeptide (TPR) repeat protein